MSRTSIHFHLTIFHATMIQHVPWINISQGHHSCGYVWWGSVVQRGGSGRYALAQRPAGNDAMAEVWKVAVNDHHETGNRGHCCLALYLLLVKSETVPQSPSLSYDLLLHSHSLPSSYNWSRVSRQMWRKLRFCCISDPHRQRQWILNLKSSRYFQVRRWLR